MLNQDEPLPPPPEEILRLATKINSSSRRNSFAGKSNILQRIQLSPPTLPIRPHFITSSKESKKRIFSSLSYVSQEVTQSETVQAQRVMISKLKSNDSCSSLAQSENISEKTAEPNEARRKRSHNSRVVPQEKLFISKHEALIVAPSIKPRFANIDSR